MLVGGTCCSYAMFLLGSFALVLEDGGRGMRQHKGWEMCVPAFRSTKASSARVPSDPVCADHASQSTFTLAVSKSWSRWAGCIHDWALQPWSNVAAAPEPAAEPSKVDPKPSKKRKGQPASAASRAVDAAGVGVTPSGKKGRLGMDLALVTKSYVEARKYNPALHLLENIEWRAWVASFLDKLLSQNQSMSLLWAYQILLKLLR